jgi:hypothetical protein
MSVMRATAVLEPGHATAPAGGPRRRPDPAEHIEQAVSAMDVRGESLCPRTPAQPRW